MDRGRPKASARSIASAAEVVTPDLTRPQAPTSTHDSAAILAAVDDYLARSAQWYERGDDAYYARICLEEAADALRQGNYGIGAVVVRVSDGQIVEFRSGNRMITGTGVIDHAETLAILAAHTTGRAPDDAYSQNLNNQTKRLASGLHVFGTLEPCPMCACAATNARAVRSVSSVPDGDPLYEGSQLIGSQGGATVLGEKARLQPTVWQNIQAGLGLQFELLQTEDLALRTLSHDIFAITRAEIDQTLATRATPVITSRGFPGISLH